MLLTVPEELAQRFEAAAVQRGISAEQLAVEVLAEHAPTVTGPRQRSFRFIGAGTAADSGPTDIHALRQKFAECKSVAGI
jgi:hypothetical protein